MTSAGNDFLCIDNRNGIHDRLLESIDLRSEFARCLCDRRFGVGADGIAILSNSYNEDNSRVSSIALESDGSECELCGNCTASLAKFVFESGLNTTQNLTIETPAGTVNTVLDGKYIGLTMPLPVNYRPDISIPYENQSIICDYIVTGIPHTVSFVNSLDSVDVDQLGKTIRHHENFAPRGVNANFVEILKEGEISIRTYEFGVEGETLACGTGSCASAVVSTIRNDWSDDYTNGRLPVTVRTRSGEIIRVYIKQDIQTGDYQQLQFETQVRVIMHGEIDRKWIADSIS